MRTRSRTGTSSCPRTPASASRLRSQVSGSPPSTRSVVPVTKVLVIANRTVYYPTRTSFAEDAIDRREPAEVDEIVEGGRDLAARLDDRCQSVGMANGVQVSRPGVLVDPEQQGPIGAAACGDQRLE